MSDDLDLSKVTGLEEILKRYKPKMIEESASLEGCIRESTNKIVAALLINAFYQTPTDLNLSPMAILERYKGILKELEGGK